MTYKRLCPTCGKTLKYYTYKNYWQNNSRNSNCEICRNQSRRNKRLGMKFDDVWRKHLKENHADFNGTKNPFYGKHHSKKTIVQISNNRKGKCTGESSPTKRQEFRKWMSENNPMKDAKIKKKWIKNLRMAMRSPAIRRKIRESRLLQLKNGDAVPSFNRKACQYFDELNKKHGWNGIHALNGGEKTVAGYSLDYYEPNLNMVIEWDEKHHYRNGQLRNEDVVRQKEIIKELGCKFFRIKQDTLEMHEVTHET